MPTDEIPRFARDDKGEDAQLKGAIAHLQELIKTKPVPVPPPPPYPNKSLPATR